MSGRLVNLDKYHGVISVGIEKVFQSLLAKIIMRTGGAEAKYSFRSVNLSAGLRKASRGVFTQCVRGQSYIRER